MITKRVKNYRVIPVKLSESSTSAHELFIKEHSSRQQSTEKPAGRTLFVLNLPPYATKESIKNVFSKAGNVENVIFQNSSNASNSTCSKDESGFKNAYVVFEKTVHLTNAMKLTQLEPLSTPEQPVLCGMKKWAKAYNSSIYDINELQKEVNKAMSEFDKETELAKKKEQESKETDEDGWTLVTKSSRKQGLVRKKSLETRIKEKIEEGTKKKELTNFYTFQIRQSKMKHLANLRKKFEEDRKKIDSLKQARKFRPY